MAKTLEKTRKQIAKKRNGDIGALHQFSRNSKRLHKAQIRDERLEKLAATRKKQDQPLSPSSNPSTLFCYCRSVTNLDDRIQLTESTSFTRQPRTMRIVLLT